MSDHVAPHLLDAFVRGELGDHTAALVAEHLDACAGCASLVREAEPLSRAFASVDAPAVPVDLVGAILASAEHAATPPPRAPWAELVVAAALVSIAGGLASVALTPSSWWGQVAGSSRGLSVLGAHLLATPSAVGTLGAISVLSTLAARALARRDRDLAG